MKEKFEPIEQKVDKKVKLRREKSLISSKIFRETGIPFSLREKLGLDKIAEMIQKEELLDEAEKEVLIKNLEEEAQLQKEISEISTQPVKILEDFRFKNLLEAFKKANQINVKKELSEQKIRALEIKYEKLNKEKIEKRLEEINQEERGYWDKNREEINMALKELREKYEIPLEKAEVEKDFEKIEGLKKEMEKFEKENPYLSKLNEFQAKKHLTLNLLARREKKKEKEYLTPSDYKILSQEKEKIKELKKEYQELLQSSPEAFIGLHLKELKNYQEKLEENKIVETPYVKEKIEEIITHLKTQIPVFLYGHYGSGKTELARHIAREYLSKEKIKEFIKSHPKPEREKFESEKDYQKALENWQGEIEKIKEPVVFRGAKDITLEELYGHLALVRKNSKSFEEFHQKVEEEKDKFFGNHPELSEEEKKYYTQLIENFVSNQESQGTITDFVLGPVYEAAKEGKVLIIDEANAIPHSVLISLNDILTRKVGEKIYVQQDGVEPITIKEGFSIILTGNLGERYEELREKMDIAFLSRVHPVEYEYLPQYYPKNKEEDSLSLKENASEKNELFHLLLAMVMDKKGNIQAPQDTIEKLWKLAVDSKVIQDVFSQKLVSQELYGYQESGGGKYLYRLTSGVPSIRNLKRIIEMWKAEKFKYELDHYLWQDFIKEITNPKDRAYVFQIFESYPGGFFEDWKHSPYSSIDAMINFEVEDPKREAESIEFYPPKEVIEAGFGKIPERKEYPEIEEKSPEEKEKILISLEKRAASIKKRIEKLMELFSDLERIGWDKGKIEKNRKILEEAESLVKEVISECEKWLSGKRPETEEDFRKIIEKLEKKLEEAVSKLEEAK